MRLLLLALSVAAFDDIDMRREEGETVLKREDFQRAAFVMYGDADDSILYRSTSKFEGDISGGLTPGNVEAVVARINAESAARNPGDGRYANAINSRSALWPTTVPYTISTRYGSRSKSRIAAAMEEYGKRTCITFVPRTTQRDYVHILPDDEQSRADRDTYVRVNYSNIKKGLAGQFKKYSLRRIQHLGAEYDYGSIMHYGLSAFSKNGEDTITPLKTTKTNIGQRFGFSPTDVAKINRLYQCQDGGGGLVTAVVVNTTAVPNRVVGGGFVVAGKAGCRDARPDCPTLVL